MTIGEITGEKNKVKNELEKLNEELKNTNKDIRDKKNALVLIQEKLEKENKKSLKRDKETNALHNKLSKDGTLEPDHHIRQKNIEKELMHIYDNLKKKLDIEKIKSY